MVCRVLCWSPDMAMCESNRSKSEENGLESNYYVYGVLLYNQVERGKEWEVEWEVEWDV